MEKEAVLASITTLSSQNLLTKDEVTSAFAKGKNQEKSGTSREIGIPDVLYFIGGFIVFLGVVILIGQNWEALNMLTRIVTTLGFGVVAYLVGVLLNKEEKYGAVGYAFHLIAGLVIPVGLGVVFDQTGYDVTDPGTQSIIMTILLSMYLVSYTVFRQPIFTFFSIVYATWLFFSFTNFLVGGNPVFMQMKFHEYRLLAVGISYICLGYYVSFTHQHKLTGPLYGFGSIFFLTAAILLGGWKPTQNMIWEALFPGIVFGFLFMSVKMKSKLFLTFGTLFLMIYILKITGEYFSGTFGWPLSLMLCGISLIGVGYYAFTINKKYISS